MFRRDGIVDRHDLVEMRLVPRRQRAGGVRRDPLCLATQIRHENLVAEPVHAGKGNRVGHGV